MIESLEEPKDCEHARSSMPAVGIHSSATACGMILDEVVIWIWGCNSFRRCRATSLSCGVMRVR
jgi:hypothetical protein